jgi:Flp pilus assembly secretin CpaC
MPSGFPIPRVIAAALAAAFAILAASAQAADDRPIVNVRLDEAKIVDLPKDALTVIVGNPQVVDLTMLKGNKKMVLTAKGFGETNLIALDKNGQLVGESLVKVMAAGTTLTLQRGASRESYHCNPRCEPTVALGDATNFMTQTISDVTTRNTAQGATSGGAR